MYNELFHSAKRPAYEDVPWLLCGNEMCVEYRNATMNLRSFGRSEWVFYCPVCDSDRVLPTEGDM